MEKYHEYPSYIYGSSYATARRHKAVRTQRAIASEVAVGDNSYYGIFRPINESDSVNDFNNSTNGGSMSAGNGLQLRRYHNYGTLGGSSSTIPVVSNSMYDYASTIADGGITDQHWWYYQDQLIPRRNIENSINNSYYYDNNNIHNNNNNVIIGNNVKTTSVRQNEDSVKLNENDSRGNEGISGDSRYVSGAGNDSETNNIASDDVYGHQCEDVEGSRSVPLQLFVHSLSYNRRNDRDAIVIGNFNRSSDNNNNNNNNNDGCSSVVDTSSYGSVNTIGANGDFDFSRANVTYPNLNATPMGSTTKLITTDTNSNYKWKCCTAKCFPIFGTLFMTLSLTVSLGNILRLPTAVYSHGGGSFLVAYIIIAILLGVPLLFLEITLGQFCQQGTTKLWRAVPLFKGVGFAKILSSILVGFYYPILVVSSLVYGSWSIIRPMPTSQCTTRLLPKYTGKEESMMNNPFMEKICSNKNETQKDIFDDELTWFSGEIIFLFVFWIIIVLCVFRGANSYRMSACIIVPISLFVTITLFAEGLQRNTDGLRYLTNIRWESLLSFELWYHALIQFFFSTHVGFGNITTCAGRLYPKNNPFWTSVSFILVNMMVGISFVCVSYMWIGDLVSSGKTVHVPESQELFILTLIYDVTSECYGRFAPIWATVVFTLIVLAGLTSMISLMYTVIVGIMVETKTKLSWWLVTVMVCFAGFVITSCCILPENFGATKLLDNYVVGKVVVTSTVLEVIGFVWVYGLEALANDFEFVLGYKLNFIWKSLWFLAPLVISVAEIWSWFTLSMEDAFHHKLDETWLYMIGWLIYLFVWSIIIGIAVWQISSQVDYNIAQKFISAIKPSRNWGPVDPIYRHCWVQWRKQYQATGERDFTLKRRGTRDYTHSVKRGKHAGPIGMQYSVNPSSNQNTLQYKMDRENSQVSPHSNVNTITSYSTWASCNSVNTYTK